jgi:hypothetical protein
MFFIYVSLKREGKRKKKKTRRNHKGRVYVEEKSIIRKQPFDQNMNTVYLDSVSYIKMQRDEEPVHYTK